MLTTDAAVLTAVSAGTGNVAAQAFWAVIAGAVELAAVVRTVRLPAETWSYRRCSKAAAIVVSLWFTYSLAGLVLPIGAIAVIWHTRTLAKRVNELPTVPDLPFAEGTRENGGDRS